MIDMGQLAILAILVLSPLFAGALKGYFASKIARIAVDFVTPTVSALSAIYFVDAILVVTGTVTPTAALSDIWYICILGVSAAFSWYAFFRLVWFGSSISDRNAAGLQNDIKNGLQLANLIVMPTLESSLQRHKEQTDDIIQTRNNTVLHEICQLSHMNMDLMEQISNVCYDVKINNLKIDQTLKTQSEIYSLVQKQSADIFHLYEIISSVEALNAHYTSDEDTSKTVLTSEDGRANRIIGHRQQDNMAQTLRDAGFDVTNDYDIAKPDYIIKDKAGSVVAVGSNKSYTLHDQPKRMQRRIAARDCQAEIILAKNLNVKMALFVTNRINSRRWMCIVKPGDLQSWDGVSTPVMLAKDDDQTGQILEEEFSNGLAELGK